MGSKKKPRRSQASARLVAMASAQDIERQDPDDRDMAARLASLAEHFNGEEADRG